jgi:hypothetical protein
MEPRDLAGLSLIEQNMLTQLTEALRLRLIRAAQERSVSHEQLATLRFITQSFHRHLQRMMELEERDGYFGWVVDTNPQLSRAVEALQAEHDRLGQRCDLLVQRMENDPNSHGQALDRTCDELLELLRELDAHSEKEATLLQDAMTRDEGGEG